MDFRTRKKYYNLCNPGIPLEPDDERYVDIDAFGKEVGKRVRGVDWTEKLTQEIILSDEPVCKLYTGFPGSGKTTHLKKLAEALAMPEMGNLFPVYIYADEVMDLSNQIDVPDILNIVLYSVERAIAEKKGQDPDRAIEEGYHKRFWNWLINTDVDFKQAEFSIPSVGKLVMEMKTRKGLRDQVRKTVADHFSHFVNMVRKELKVLEEEARCSFGCDGLVVIYDSLEKLRGTSDNFEAVLMSAEKVFMGNAPYIKLPVHVIYTVPASLTTRVKNIDFIPMIKVHLKNGEPCEIGLEAAGALVRKRVPDDVARMILGRDFKERIRKMILNSGGYPREILQLMQKVIAQTEYPVSDQAFGHILKEIANEYREVVFGDAIEWLATVAVTKYLIIDNEEQRRRADNMLQNHVVLRYLNDELWFDLHPAVKAIPEVQVQIKKMSSEG